jgi:Pretoxin HINT domain
LPPTPKTGKTSAEPVTAVLLHHDTDRYDLRIKTARGTAVIQTTSSHLFWDATAGRWVKAAALGYGSHLSTGGGANVTVLNGYVPAEAAGWMWDLTVASDHDFYVDVATTAVLVHNCPVSPGGVGNLADGVRMSTNDALDTADEFLGEGYQDAGDGRFINGARQVRMTDADIANPSVEPHLNFEEWENPIQPGVRNNLIFNYHVFLPEEPLP